jgi:hypothetical protein
MSTGARLADAPFQFFILAQVTRSSVARMSGESLYHHLIAARTRHQQKGDDFSAWPDGSLGLEALARKIDEIDVMECTLEGARARILQLIDGEKASSAENWGARAVFGTSKSINATIGSERATGDRHEMDTGWNQPGR